MSSAFVAFLKPPGPRSRSKNLGMIGARFHRKITKARLLAFDHIGPAIPTTVVSRNFAGNFWNVFWNGCSHVFSIICILGGCQDLMLGSCQVFYPYVPRDL